MASKKLMGDKFGIACRVFYWYMDNDNSLLCSLINSVCAVLCHKGEMSIQLAERLFAVRSISFLYFVKEMHDVQERRFEATD